MNTSTSTNITSSNGSGSPASKTGADRHAADRGRDIANQTFDQLAHAVESARATAVPAIEKFTTGAESMAQRSVELARIKSQQMRDQAHLASEKTATYVRQEPVKSLLIAAAAGALLAWLLSPSKRDRH